MSGARLLWCLSGSTAKASSRVRGHQVASALKPFGFAQHLLVGRGQKGLMRVAARLADADVLILQKTVSRHHVRLATLAKAMGRQVALDLDDHPAPDGSRITMLNFARLARLADVVFAGSEQLVNLVRDTGGKPVLVPTTVAASPPLPAEAGPLHLGWVGHPRYCDEIERLLAPPLRALTQHRTVRLTLVGVDRAPKLAAIDGLILRCIPAIDWADPAALPRAFAGVHVGLYPLAETPFNRHKCAYKALQYMSLGLPVVASPVGAINMVVRDGVDGFVSPDFTASLTRLADAPELRAQMGAAGRTRALTDYSPTRAAEAIASALRPARLAARAVPDRTGSGQTDTVFRSEHPQKQKDRLPWVNQRSPKTV